nr:uncharacterized protein LOC128683292 [Plodia interpunctella]
MNNILPNLVRFLSNFHIFKRLPEVDKCVMLPLKIGCMAIALWYIWTSGVIIVMAIYTKYFFNNQSYNWVWLGNKYQCIMNKNDYKANTVECPQYMFLNSSFKAFILLVETALFIGSVVLCIGVHLQKTKCLTVFLYTYITTRAIDLFFMIVFIAIGAFGSCKAKKINRFNCMASFSIVLTTTFYVIVVVNSLRSYMRKIAALTHLWIEDDL